ncbi:MAG: hypothetical protein JNG86_16750 [Verrucomicrobiaceae bacterium]|nr:hypothetical protein [Verrucomicrobiaceae bacterium]
MTPLPHMRAICPAIITLLGMLSALRAQTPAPVPTPASAPQSAELAEILQKLAAVKTSFDAQKKEVAAAALARYTAGAQSEAGAVALHVNCLQIVQGRVPDLDGTSKQDAREQEDRLKAIAERDEDSPGRAALLQLQLQFLVFTMQAQGLEDQGVVMSRLKEFATRTVGMIGTHFPADSSQKSGSAGGGKSRKDKDRAQEAREMEAARRDFIKLARANIMGSIFAEAYNLSNYFEPPEKWPKALLDLDGIFIDQLIPYQRMNKPDLLAKEWDDYIKLTATVEKLTNDEATYARWLVGAYKGLQWKRAMDILRHGTQRAAAADELVKLIKENPTHPAIGSWASQLEAVSAELLNPTAPSAPAPPAPATN